MRILALAGSLRAESFNRRLLENAVAFLRTQAEVDLVASGDLVLPLFNADVEVRDGLPEAARRLRDRIAAADALVIATPEYNNSIPGGLKNAIDWVSRGKDQPFRGRPVLQLSASPGPYGGIRAQMTLRIVLASVGAVALPTSFALPHADKAFDDAGVLVDPRQRAQVEKGCNELLRFATSLRS
jgi:chromate reductase, NAD(P)H dehydrogenase (quinone)